MSPMHFVLLAVTVVFAAVVGYIAHETPYALLGLPFLFVVSAVEFIRETIRD